MIPREVSSDEQAIRAVMARWQQATAAGAVTQGTELMTEDVIFLTAGQPPMRGREAFTTGMHAALVQY